MARSSWGKLQIISKQDQLTARIRDEWLSYSEKTQGNLIEHLELDDLDEVRESMFDMPDRYVAFLHACSLAGIRQSLIDYVK